MRILLLWALGLAAAFAQSSADFFSDAVLHEIRIEINPKDLKALIDNYADNTYYPANLSWKNLLVETVGIRSKEPARGKTGSARGCRSF
jgi:spore coat protein CotH